MFTRFAPIVLGASIALAGVARADETNGRPQSALLESVKAFVRQEGYQLSFSLVAGTSTDGGKSIAVPDTRQSYAGPVHRRILALSQERIFLTADGGAAFDAVSNRWVKISNTAEGRLVSGTLRMPEAVLAEACKGAGRAEWIASDRIRIPVAGAALGETFNSIQNSGCAGGT